MLDLLERQETLTRNQWRIIATANLGDMLDFFDFFLIGYVLAFIIGGWHLSPTLPRRTTTWGLSSHGQASAKRRSRIGSKR